MEDNSLWKEVVAAKHGKLSHSLRKAELHMELGHGNM